MCDRYTKIVLTVIAACLMWLCVRDLPLASDVLAQAPRQRAARQQATEQSTQEIREADKKKIEEATPVKIVAVDEILFRTWPKTKDVYTPLPSFIQGGHVNIEGHVDATPY